MRATHVALLHGSSLRFGLCCPEPSTLSRPDPPHLQAQHNFIARRLICAAFAVRERLGDPQVVPGFNCTFLPDMPSFTTPGSSTSISSRAGTSTLAFTDFRTARHSQHSRNPFHAGFVFRGFSGSRIATACQVARPPCTDLTGSLRPPGTFTSGLPVGRSPFPPPGMTTTVTGLLCWRDFHPLEWQLASLHRKSTKRVLSGWSVSSYRARRLPKTSRTRLASWKSANAITASSANRTRVLFPLRRGCTSFSNHSSSTWCRKTFDRQGEITPPCGEPSVAWRRSPSSSTPAFSHLSIILRMTPSVTRLSRNERKWECEIDPK